MFVCVWSTRKSWFPHRRDTYYVIHDFTKRNTLGNPHIIYRRPMTIGQVVRGSILPNGGKVEYLHKTNGCIFYDVYRTTHHIIRKKREVDFTRGLSFHHLLFLFILVVFAENRKSELSVPSEGGGT